MNLKVKPTREYLNGAEIEQLLVVAKSGATRNPERNFCALLLLFRHGSAFPSCARCNSAISAWSCARFTFARSRVPIAARLMGRNKRAELGRDPIGNQRRQIHNKRNGCTHFVLAVSPDLWLKVVLSPRRHGFYLASLRNPAGAGRRQNIQTPEKTMKRRLIVPLVHQV